MAVEDPQGPRRGSKTRSVALPGEAAHDFDPAASSSSGPGAPAHPDRVGPYTVLEALGQGGMGIVYLVEQREPIRRRLALKLIKMGMDTREVIARFESERQALAVMNHPNIARVFDAGATPDGRPYFAMEYVQGLPIDEYCDRHKSSVKERLELFIQICHGLQHAHLKGIVHRDIKPSNILVAASDEQVVAKIIDFGVAKATSQRLTEKTIYTELGRMIGTPQYMSPEQAEMTTEDVDHRTDIYSLGVLLYELLVGELPLEWDSLSRAAFDEVLRRIREDDPPTPSTRWTRLNPETTRQLALLRRTNPTSLARELRGSLDWIVMKAMEKDRSRRYGTAAQLAEEIGRHLRNEPTLAGPPSVIHKARRFARRYRGLVTAAAAVFLALCAGFMVSLVLYADARKSRELADSRRFEAEAALEDARWQAYLSNISAGALAIETGDHAEARRRLEACPKEHRGWEWRHLGLRLDPSVKRLRLEGPAVDAAFSPDGARLAAIAGDSLLAWDVQTWMPVRSGKREGVGRSLAFSPDGRRLATAGKKVRLWDARTLEELPSSSPEAKDIEELSFTSEGKLLAVGREGAVLRVWDGETGSLLASLRGTSLVYSQIPWSTAIALSRAGDRVAVGTGHGWMQTWEVEGGKSLGEWSLPDVSLGSVAFRPDGESIASGANNHEGGKVILWRQADNANLQTVLPHGSEITCIAWSPDGRRFLSGGDDGSLKLWEAETGETRLELKPHDDSVECAAFSPDGSLFATGSRDTLNVWDSRTRQGAFLPLRARVFRKSTKFSPDGRRIASCGARGVTLWNAANGERLRDAGQELTRCVAFSPDGKLIASGGRDRTVQVRSVESLETLCVFRGHRCEVGHVAFSPDGKLVASGDSDSVISEQAGEACTGAVLVWEARTGSLIASLDPAKSSSGEGSSRPAGGGISVWSLAFSPDGTRLAVAESDTVRIYDRSSWKAAGRMEGDGEQVTCIAFSPDSSRIAGSGNQIIRLWDSRTGKLVGALKGHRGFALCVAFSLDGTRLASGGEDRTVRLWDARRGQLLVTLQGHAAWVNSVAFSPDGRRIVSSAQEDRNGVRIWESELASALEIWQHDEILSRLEPLIESLFEERISLEGVLAALEADASLEPGDRQALLRLACAHGGFAANELNALAWKVARTQGASEAAYSRAAQQAKAASDLEPENPFYLNTLGVALYRHGRHEEALAALIRADELNRKSPAYNRATDLLFIAMCRHKLEDDAEDPLAEARTLIDPSNRELLEFLREAEALLGSGKR